MLHPYCEDLENIDHLFHGIQAASCFGVSCKSTANLSHGKSGIRLLWCSLYVAIHLNLYWLSSAPRLLD